MGDCLPRVSIGMPVYNGENFLEAALNSILAQTFQDFELIISDNASTDRTQAICQDYAAHDSRIRYYRNDTNLGASPNFNRLVYLARAEYFKWAAHDDLLAPTFLERCVAVLDHHPDVILAYSQTNIINAEETLYRPYQYDSTLRVDAAESRRRFHDLVCVPQYCFQIFGLCRKAILVQTPLQGSYGHADGVLLARLALMGKFHEIPQHLFFSRQHPEQCSTRFIWNHAQPDYYGMAQWMDSRLHRLILLPRWRILLGYLLSIWEVPIAWLDRLVCHWHLLSYIRTWKDEMGTELKLIGQQFWQLGQFWLQTSFLDRRNSRTTSLTSRNSPSTR